MAAPVVANRTPTPPSLIDSDDSVSFDVTSVPALQRVMVFVLLPGAEVQEVVHDGTDFTSRYSAFSSRTAIANGFRFTIRRQPVWPDSPTVAIFAINTALEETSSSWVYTLTDSIVELYDSTLPAFPVGLPDRSLNTNLESFDQDYFLRLVGRTLDSEYVAGLQNGEGYEVLQAQAKMAERASLAVKRTGEGLFASFAQGPAYATGTVEFYRTAVATASVDVLPGTVLSSTGGRMFITLETVTFAPADLGPKTARVRAVFPTWQHNVQGAVVTPGGITIEGEIDEIKVLCENPPFGDPTIRVRQITELTGGRTGDLDMLAREVNLQRRANESDDNLAFRIRNLPDNISPNAIQRQVKALLYGTGATYAFVETWESRRFGYLDCEFTQPWFVYDDVRSRFSNVRNLWLDNREHWGTFWICTSKIQPLKDLGGMYDEAASTAAQLRSSRSGGRRAVSAYDLPDLSTTGTETFFGFCYDGRDVGQDGLNRSLRDTLDKNRAAGIVAGLMQEGRY